MPRSRGTRPRLAILGSGRGSNAVSLMTAFRRGELPAELALVVCNVAGAPLIDRAREHGYPVVCLPHVGLSREAHEEKLSALLTVHGVEHLLLAGYMRLLSPAFLRRFPGHVLNIHPSLLPAFPGLDAAAAQWQAGVRTAGATVHFVDEGVDTGPILLAQSIAVRGDEGAAGLAERIRLEVELALYPRAVRLFLARLARGLPLPPAPSVAGRSAPHPGER